MPDKKELVWNLTHPQKSRRERRKQEVIIDDSRSERETSRSRERERRYDRDRSRRNNERSDSSGRKSRPYNARSRSNVEIIRPNQDVDKTGRERSRSNQRLPTSERSRRNEFRLNEDRQITRKERSNQKEETAVIKREVVRINLPISNAGKLEGLLHFFPRFRTCCCCWSLRTGCLIIGWTQVVGCVIVGGVQSMIALVCFDNLNLEEIFNNFPPEFNPAKAVSDYDYCAGLSVGYASGEAVGFFTGIMLLFAISKDLMYLLKYWVYVVLIMMLPTLTFYGVAIYAIIEYENDIAMIAVPSAIELATFVVLCYCASIVKSYYYQRLEHILGEPLREPFYLQDKDYEGVDV